MSCQFAPSLCENVGSRLRPEHVRMFLGGFPCKGNDARLRLGC